MARLTIVLLGELHRDGRVLRQISHLSQVFEVSVVAYGNMPESVAGLADMYSVRPPSGRGITRKLRFLIGLFVGRFITQTAYDDWYWSRLDHQQAFSLLVQSQPDLIHANDWHALPLSAKAVEQTGAHVLADLHEYSPLQYENRRAWRIWRAPMIDYFLRRYKDGVDQFVTVGQIISERYVNEYGFSADVIRNAPDIRDGLQQTESATDEPVDDGSVTGTIRLIHHGAAMADRQLELMIEVMSQLQERFTLDFMLVPADEAYYRQLQETATTRLPGRIRFLEPVEPHKIVETITKYDIGFYLLPPANFNQAAALPNKFFEFIAAGLAVCIGPSPEMVALTEEHKCGIISPSFEPEDVAQILNNLTVEEIEQMKKCAVEAGRLLNAKVEMAKLIALYQSLLNK